MKLCLEEEQAAMRECLPEGQSVSLECLAYQRMAVQVCLSEEQLGLQRCLETEYPEENLSTEMPSGDCVEDLASVVELNPEEILEEEIEFEEDALSMEVCEEESIVPEENDLKTTSFTRLWDSTVREIQKEAGWPAGEVGTFSFGLLREAPMFRGYELACEEDQTAYQRPKSETEVIQITPALVSRLEASPDHRWTLPRGPHASQTLRVERDSAMGEALYLTIAFEDPRNDYFAYSMERFTLGDRTAYGYATSLEINLSKARTRVVNLEACKPSPLILELHQIGAF